MVEAFGRRSPRISGFGHSALQWARWCTAPSGAARPLTLARSSAPAHVAGGVFLACSLCSLRGGGGHQLARDAAALHQRGHSQRRHPTRRPPVHGRVNQSTERRRHAVRGPRILSAGVQSESGSGGGQRSPRLAPVQRDGAKRCSPRSRRRPLFWRLMRGGSDLDRLPTRRSSYRLRGAHPALRSDGSVLRDGAALAARARRQHDLVGSQPVGA
jgi:hypothetical protein